ncbi:MAG TPA: pilin [Candidatus Doudnabacteria bacterium]|nr:pilin [Candidatus Doudnabacteria bacterium]
MKSFFLGIGAVAIAISMLLITPLAVSGQSDRVQDGLNAISNTFPVGARDTGDANVESLAKRIIDWALYLAALVAVLFIIVGGYYYMTARGNDEQAKQGRKTLVNALIGLTLVVLAFLIVQVVYRFITQQGT